MEAIPKLNRVVVQANPETRKEVRDLVRELDKVAGENAIAAANVVPNQLPIAVIIGGGRAMFPRTFDNKGNLIEFGGGFAPGAFGGFQGRGGFGPGFGNPGGFGFGGALVPGGKMPGMK